MLIQPFLLWIFMLVNITASHIDPVQGSAAWSVVNHLVTNDSDSRYICKCTVQGLIKVEVDWEIPATVADITTAVASTTTAVASTTTAAVAACSIMQHNKHLVIIATTFSIGGVNGILCVSR